MMCDGLRDGKFQYLDVGYVDKPSDNREAVDKQTVRELVGVAGCKKA